MDIARVIGIALATTFAVLLLKPTKPEIAALVSVVGGLLVIMMFVESLQTIIDSMASLISRTGIRSELFSALLRIIGIGYLTEFAANVCDEAGNTSMAKKVTLAGKLLILILALPIINNLIEIIIGVMP
ncbi:MAG: stage III sporulation AC/AD family protein [Firmicutes bacterium]|nr:stage III sporulation AC/AD family protein [Bacillota bacterium]